MIFVHTVHTLNGAMNTGVLVITQKKAFFALTFVAAHSIYTYLLAPSIVILTLIDIKTVVAIMG